MFKMAVEAMSPTRPRREVSEFDGSFSDAVAANLIPQPPLMDWNGWQRWRSTRQADRFNAVIIDAVIQVSRHSRCIRWRKTRQACRFNAVIEDAVTTASPITMGQLG